MTELQINFIQRAVENYRQTILEELFGVPDEISDIPDWAHSEINDLMKALYGAGLLLREEHGRLHND